MEFSTKISSDESCINFILFYFNFRILLRDEYLDQTNQMLHYSIFYKMTYNHQVNSN